MLKSERYRQAQKLALFIETMPLQTVEKRTDTYHHMGATITDAILQAGLNYRHVVWPRVAHLLRNFPDYTTTCDFLILMKIIPLSELLNWHNKRKLTLIEKVSNLFYDNNIETEFDLAPWLNKQRNEQYLLSLNGIGFKTIDYLKMLTGLQSIAIDRHLLNFLKLADIMIDTYQEARDIYYDTAKLLCMGEHELDRKVWLFMSSTTTFRGKM